EDGIRDFHVTGVQTCALPILPTWNRLPGRNSGWWDPVIAGSLLTAALGLHLPAALWGKKVWRALGIAGCAITLPGILATGTRGRSEERRVGRARRPRASQ